MRRQDGGKRGCLIRTVISRSEAAFTSFRYMNYLELDALYALKYMQTLEPGYRKEDIREAVYEYGKRVIDYWKNGRDELLSMHPHRILAAI